MRIWSFDSIISLWSYSRVEGLCSQCLLEAKPNLIPYHETRKISGYDSCEQDEYLTHQFSIRYGCLDLEFLYNKLVYTTSLRCL